MGNYDSVRICKNLKELLEGIMEIERERGQTCSYKNASEILYRRIIRAGGLKKD